MNWEAKAPVAGLLLAYLGFLFLVAAIAERFGPKLRATRLQTVQKVDVLTSSYIARSRYSSRPRP